MTRYLEIKPGSISETIKRLSDDYQAYFKKELEKTGKGIAQMTDAEKKAFFNKIDKEYNAKNEQTKKIDELTAGQKKLPPALQKAIKAKEKKEAVDNPYAVGMAAAMKATGDKPPLKKSTIVKAHDIAKSIEKKEEVKISEEFSAELKAKAKEIAKKFAGNITKAYDEIEKIAKGLSNEPEVQKALKMANEEVKLEAVDLKLLKPGNYITVKSKEYVVDKIDGEIVKASNINGDFKYFKIKDIEKIQSSYSLAAEFKPEDGIDLSEGGFKDIDIRKGDLKLARDKRQQLKDKYNAIMANQAQGDESAIADQIQKLDMSIKKQEQDLIDKMKKLKDNEKNEAIDPERISKLQQSIAKMNTQIGALDKSKPESKTKEAILQSDIETKKLRLQDLMQKKAGETEKAMSELKKSYKSLKMSMKKEQDTDNRKKTLTDKPLTKIEVNPKIEG